MDYSFLNNNGTDIVLNDVNHFNIDEILDCGQCFRWAKLDTGVFKGVAYGKILQISQVDNIVTFHNTSIEDFNRIWSFYFDFERDYGSIKNLLVKDKSLAAAIDFCPGIRVVRQEPWEALCSFIISSNNNIPRIKGIIERLCENFGTPIADNAYDFPKVETIALLSLEDLGVLRSGFRAKYILDAARLISSGNINLESLYTADLQDARSELKRINGVGPKVAECALLYGFARAECFPIDVWITRAVNHLYPDGFPTDYNEYAGIAQQYLFHYVRKSGIIV